MSALLPFQINSELLLGTAVLILLGFALALSRRILQLKAKHEQDVSELKKELTDLNSELKALTKADFGVGKRLIRVEHQLADLEEKHEDLTVEVGSDVDCQQISGIVQEADLTYDDRIELSQEEQSLLDLMNQRLESLEEEG